MKPKRQESVAQEDLFQMRLESMIDSRHELVRLTRLIDWSVFEPKFGALRSGRFGPVAAAHPTHGGAHLPQALLCAFRRRSGRALV